MNIWRIAFVTCLAIAICFTMVSAAIESPFMKSSFDKQTAFANAKASAIESLRTDWTSFDREPAKDPGGIQEPDLPDASVDLALPAITRPAFNPLPAPTFHVPERTFPRTTPSSWTKQSVYTTTITKDEAIEIALAQFPGGDIGSIQATLKRINAPDYPLAVNPCWVVEILGVRSDCSAHWKVPGYGIDKTIPLMPCSPYGGQVIIDALTGEVLYVNGWA